MTYARLISAGCRAIAAGQVGKGNTAWIIVNDKYLRGMVRIAVYASGNGTNAENLIRYFRDHQHCRIELVVSNNPGSRVLQRAEKLGVETYVISKEDIDGREQLVVLKKHNIDLVVLAGYLKLVPDAITKTYEGRIVNIHPSLLPKFGGKGMYGMRVHKAVIDAGEERSGITIHHVNEQFDDGRIIRQVELKVNKGETADELAARIHELEHHHYPLVVEELISGFTDPS